MAWVQSERNRDGKQTRDVSLAVSLAETISALSFALDLTEDAVPGHALRTCLIGMRMAAALNLSGGESSSLYYALLLKDVGCSSNSARMCQIIGGGDDRAVKAGAKLEDWTRPHQPQLSTLQLLWQHAAPEAGAAGKAWQILKIGLTQHKNNAEMIGLRWTKPTLSPAMPASGPRSTPWASRSRISRSCCRRPMGFPVWPRCSASKAPA